LCLKQTASEAGFIIHTCFVEGTSSGFLIGKIVKKRSAMEGGKFQALYNYGSK